MILMTMMKVVMVMVMPKLTMGVQIWKRLVVAASRILGHIHTHLNL